MAHITENDDGTHTVWHGAYGNRTPFDIVQHRYGCTDCENERQGFIEILEIRNAPKDRSQFMIHVHLNDDGSRVYDFSDLAAANASFDTAWHAAFHGLPLDMEERLSLLVGGGRHRFRHVPGFLGQLFYANDEKTPPWFYPEH